ncbi:hypothetical protein [Candidatus Phytoplasma solani]|uniref:Uncharacterized protein n=1 Tax=Candidatus Phytoplasma solani TaxID=69896 RepID=A0A421NYS6_9MOLU|nr:hypothetical protein [Candidatus Phytoplasma solani]RMI89158.1 hypothetical protein PSSA1_v1c0380 [Candidatus Phytoplasma solani]CCP88412.1 conserved hypothetical protein [Candidatus Phytoplasma solani]
MNWSSFFPKKTKQMQLLTNFYHSLQGEPFLIEEILLNETPVKIEFYYLEQSKYYNALFQTRQFVVWTADKGTYRLLIDKDYYNNFKPLYRKEINTAWLEFMIQVYQKEANLINRIKLAFLGFFIPILLVIFLTLTMWSPGTKEEGQKTLIFGIPLVILLIVIFVINYWIKIQQKKMAFFKDQTLQKTLTKIKQILGEEFFAELLEKQKNYNPFFAKSKNEQDNNPIV